MIWRFGFFVSVVWYLLFLFFEWLRPGFVSFVFSPHLFLLAAIIFGWGWSRTASRAGFHLLITSRSPKTALTCLVLGLTLAAVFWVEGRSLQEFRPLVVLIAFFTPRLVYLCLRRRPSI